MMKINVKVIANSSKSSIENTSEGLKVHLKEKSVKGKANKALIELLADHFKKKKAEISIKRGITSNNKIVEISYGN